MAALIRRTRSNLSVTPGTSMSSVVSSPIKKNIIPLASVIGADIVSGATLSVFKGGGGGTTSVPTAVLREDTSVFVPTQAQKNVITPQQVINGQVIQIEKVSVTNAQEGIINVEYSTPTLGKASTVSAPIVKTVSNVGQAGSLSKILGRTVEVGEGLTQADITKINTPRASTGFSGGMGYGQAFPVNEEIFKLGQAAVNKSRLFGLAVKAAYSVSLPGGGTQQRSLTFTKTPTAATAMTQAPKKTLKPVKNLSLAIQGFYK